MYENRINEGIIPQSNIIQFQISTLKATRAICKINTYPKISSGFLIKLFKNEENFFCLMTNEHIITREMVNQRKKITFYYDLESKVKDIYLNSEERYIKDFTDINIDAIVIEILPKDKVDEEYFLLSNIYYMDKFNELKNKEITILQYPLGQNLSFSNGIITDINIYEFTHKASTQEGSSGSPIFLKDNLKVIGIHKQGNMVVFENYGDFIGPVFNFFRNGLKHQMLLDNNNYNDDTFEFNDSLINNNIIENDLSVNVIYKEIPFNGYDEILNLFIYENGSYYINYELEPGKSRLKEILEYLRKQYEICDKAGPVASDSDFDPQSWKKFYPTEDPFFNFDKGFVVHFGIKIKHPSEPEKLSIYEGDVNLKRERHGFGRLTTIKSVYLGEWRNGSFTGWGRETRRSGKIYEGKFIDGFIQGKGILKNDKGVTFVGDFLNSKRHGKGILDTSKVHYEGDFKNDKLCGKGKINFKPEGHSYEGEFDNNEINGFGTFKWKNGDSYIGFMRIGKMHGNGKYFFNNGLVYEGKYNNGVKEGKGKVYRIKK